MKKFGILFVFFSILSLFFSTESFAQRGMRAGAGNGWGIGSSYNRMYNPKTVATINGEVVSIDKITPMKGMSYGIHLMMKTGKESISIHVGPAWYLDRQNFVIKAKDKIKVIGSRITFDGKPAIIAAEIHNGNKVIKLRDENGYPLWSRGRK